MAATGLTYHLRLFFGNNMQPNQERKELVLFLTISRKEVFQPHLPVRLPCYDLAPITSFALGRPSR